MRSSQLHTEYAVSIAWWYYTAAQDNLSEGNLLSLDSETTTSLASHQLRNNQLGLKKVKGVKCEV
jgi:hypothetical protein